MRLRKLLAVGLSLAMTLQLSACGSSAETSSEQTGEEAVATADETEESGAVPADDVEAPAPETSASELAYKGEINFMHYSTSEEAEGNGSSDGFRSCIAAWEEAHPDIALNQDILANVDYKTQIATKAAANDLPDVFLLQGSNTANWAKQ